MNKKIIKQTVATALLTSSIFSFSTITYGKETTIQQSIDAVKLEMKKAPLYYVDPALKSVIEPSKDLYPVLNNLKKHYNEIKKQIHSSNLSSKEKKDKIKELDSLYEEKIIKGVIPYIDAYNYAVKYLDPILKEMLAAHAAGDLDGVEKAYHKLSYQLDSRTSILYRFTGKAPRDLLLEKYKKPSDVKREELRIPVTIYMKNNEVLRLWNEGKKEEARKLMDEVLALSAKTSNNTETNYSNLLSKEVKDAEALFATNPIPQPEVPSNPPTSGGGNETPSESSAQRALRLAKSNAITELTNYKIEKDYNSEDWLLIQSLKNTGINAITSAASTTEVSQALTNAKTDIDAVKTIAQIETEQQNALASAKNLAVDELTNYKNESDYSPENWLIIQSLKTTGTNAISTVVTTTEVAQALANSKSAIDAVKTIAQEETEQQNALASAKNSAINELTSYKNEADYSPENWLIIQSMKTNGRNSITTAVTTTEVAQALANAKADIDVVKTIDQEETEQQNALASAKNSAVVELTNYKNEADYSPENWLIIQSLKTTGTNAISTAVTTTEVTQALANAKMDIDAVKTIAQIETEQQNALAFAKNSAIDELTNYKNESDYSPENWLIIQSLKTTGKTAISSALTTTEVAQALANAKADIDFIQTLEEEQQELVDAEAAAILSTFNPPTSEVGTSFLPLVREGFSIKVSSTSNEEVYDLNGNVQKDGKSNVIYTVTHLASGKKANTETIEVIVVIKPLVSENQNPTVVGVISPQLVTDGITSPVIFDLSQLFDDPDGDSLSYKLVNNQSNIIHATIDNDYLQISPGTNAGEITITIEANDGKGGTASTTVTVRNAPLVNNGPIKIFTKQGIDTITCDISKYFPGKSDFLVYKGVSSFVFPGHEELKGSIWTGNSTDKYVWLIADDGTAIILDITAVPQGTPEVYFSEYLDGGDGRIALELFNNGVLPSQLLGYELEVHKYVKATNSREVLKTKIENIGPIPYIIMNSTFYDFMDITPVQYFNIDLDIYNPNRFVVTAYVLKKDGRIVDILGDINSQEQFLKDGGTIVRKPKIYTGSQVFSINGEWNVFPKGTYGNIGKHTP